MSDMKEFLEKHEITTNGDEILVNPCRLISAECLGLFFWNRGGKIYCLKQKGFYKNLKELIILALDDTEYYTHKGSQDFLDCVACLGEEEVKELIEILRGRDTTKELKGELKTKRINTNKTLKSFELNKEGMKTK